MRAVMYCRSSKDREEVSLDAQREALQSLASKHGLEVVGSYEDAVYSGTTDERPGFQALLGEIRDRGRAFDHILIYDTSRIARDQLIAQVFKRECEKRGVRIMYATLPADLDPITGLVLHAVFEAFDQMHSMMSRQKGLAGMRQNVLKGWRAGGRAPMGYRLVHEPTGVMRDSKPVLKSRLELGADADGVRQYLQLRARGTPRTVAIRECGLSAAATTMIGVEWNALLYAGHTVWNVHADKKARGLGQRKRRDRSQWVIQRGTHPALISELEAETVLARIETSERARAVREARAATSDYLLSGIIETSDGRPWVGFQGRRYRLKPCAGRRGRYVSREALEQGVLDQVRSQVTDPAFIARLQALRSTRRSPASPRQDLARSIAKLEREAERAAALAVRSEDPMPFVALADRKRAEAKAMRRRVELEGALSDAQPEMEVTAERMALALQSEANVRAVVRTMVERVELNEDCRARLHYKARSLGVASPRGFEPLSPP